MPLRLRSVVPYTLPGVLALIGWFWYASRKKEPIGGDHNHSEGAESEEEVVSATMGLLASPSEGSNGVVETAGARPTARDTTTPPKPKSQKSTEQKVEAQVHATVATPPELRSSRPQTITTTTDSHPDSSPAQPVGPLHHRLIASETNSQEEQCSTATPPQDRPPSPVALATETVPVALESHSQHGPQPVSEEGEIVAVSQVTCLATKPVLPPAPANTDRPEPEGEVSEEDSSALSITITATTKDVPAPPARSTATPEPPSLEREDPSSSLSPSSSQGSLPLVSVTKSTTSPPKQATPFTSATPPRSASPTLQATPPSIQGTPPSTQVTPPSAQGTPPSAQATPPSAQAQPTTQITPQATSSTLSTPPTQAIPRSEATPPPQENGAPTKGAELEHTAAGVVSDAIAAAAQVLGVELNDESPAPASHTRGSSTPLANGRPGPEPTPPSATETVGWPSPIELGGGDSACWQEEAVTTAVSNGCLSALPSVWGESRDYSHGDGVKLVEPKQQEVHEVSLPSLEELSGESSVTAASRAEEEELALGAMICAVGRGLNGAGLRNGAHGVLSETETDQSGGSDVNSMDSVDSGCTMGVGDSHSSLSSAHNSELVIWEIEVPKHLVGRLIGKQGRYVSFLKQSSGAKIYISTLPYTQEFQICHIEGSQQQVDKALSLIGKKFKDMDLTNLYAPPSALNLPSLPMTSWLLLPTGVMVEVVVVNIVSAGHLFVQQHTHPSYHVLRSLDQQMFMCYSQPGVPALPSPAEVGLICAAPAVDGAWWRAQVIAFYKETSEVEIRYVDYGGYDRVKIDALRQIRSDFVTLPFQGAEVLLDNITPLPGEEGFSSEASVALEEMTRGVALLAQVTNYDNNTGVPLVQMWNMAGEELVSVNRTLAERGLATWVDSF